MGWIYVNKQQSIDDEPNYVGQDFTIFDLLTSPTQDGVVKGIRFLEQGTPEWQKYIDTLVKKVQGPGYQSKEEIIRIRKRLESKKTFVDSSGISGIKYTYGSGFDRNYFNFVADSETNAIAHIVVPQRRIIMLPLINPVTGHHDAFLFGKWNKASTDGYFYYDGTIEEILREFSENGFSFHEAIPRTFFGKHDGSIELQLPCGGHVRVVRENVPLEEVVSSLHPAKK